jgi:hypothetical protein
MTQFNKTGNPEGVVYAGTGTVFTRIGANLQILSPGSNWVSASHSYTVTGSNVRSYNFIYNSTNQLDNQESWIKTGTTSNFGWVPLL